MLIMGSTPRGIQLLLLLNPCNQRDSVSESDRTGSFEKQSEESYVRFDKVVSH